MLQYLTQDWKGHLPPDLRRAYLTYIQLFICMGSTYMQTLL